MKTFKYAFSGIFSAIKSERNMRIHLAFTFYVILAGFITKITKFEWLIVLLCFALVMSLELLNTSIESLCNKISPEFDEKIKISKDTAAGAVLVSTIISTIIGIIIFVNEEKIKLALRFFKENPYHGIIIFASLVPISCLVFKKRKTY